MKNLIAFLGCSIVILLGVVESLVVLDVPYGEHEDQILHLHIPDDDSIRLNKILIMLHGGAWWMGRKEDLNPHVAVIREKLPDYAIANMNYQLGSAESPRFPKQLDDIKAVIAFLKSSFTSDLSIAVFGNSAGALLALLYSYRWDEASRDVKAVISHVGPVDLMVDFYCKNLSRTHSLSNC
ncbi:kynurenine formamidase-like [Folsomia candida]|uniref:kynurenine formamidase-like n=1 Tax=Folsomia candida TaxID=158441 RepID=UPI001604C0E7|nr:kynurenine formamidase-like [Folsomia candida]